MERDRSGTRLLVLNASQKQRLGYRTVFCALVNRAIGTRLCFPIISGNRSLTWGLGTGVFITPAILLRATGSPGASLLLWSLGAITRMCSLLVWLEFGLQSQNLSFKIGTMTVPRPKVYLCRTYQEVVGRRTM